MVRRRWPGRRDTLNPRCRNWASRNIEVESDVRRARQDGGNHVACSEHHRRGFQVVIATCQLAAIATVTLKSCVGRCGCQLGLGNERAGRTPLPRGKNVRRLAKVKLRGEQ